MCVLNILSIGFETSSKFSFYYDDFLSTRSFILEFSQIFSVILIFVYKLVVVQQKEARIFLIRRPNLPAVCGHE